MCWMPTRAARAPPSPAPSCRHHHGMHQPRTHASRRVRATRLDSLIVSAECLQRFGWPSLHHIAKCGLSQERAAATLSTSDGLSCVCTLDAPLTELRRSPVGGRRADRCVPYWGRRRLSARTLPRQWHDQPGGYVACNATWHKPRTHSLRFHICASIQPRAWKPRGRILTLSSPGGAPCCTSTRRYTHMHLFWHPSSRCVWVWVHRVSSPFHFETGPRQRRSFRASGKKRLR